MLNKLYLLCYVLFIAGYTFAQDVSEQQARAAAEQYFQSLPQGSNSGPQSGTIDAMSSQSFLGHVTGEQFGASPAASGDINGDGYIDLIVGAPYYNNNTGRVYVFYGGIVMDNTADIVLTGETVNSYFGLSIACPGDINGDGFADIVVGAYGAGSTNRGKVYVYFGRSTPFSYASVELTGEDINNFFGTSVATAGDVNGDGFPDFIVGANGNNGNNGKAYIYYGGIGVTLTPNVMLSGSSGSYFASTVAGVGDVNNDGYDDVAVGEYPWSSNTGRAFVYFGGSPMNNVSDVTLTGPSAGSKFSKSIAGGKDINGDGIDDIAIGSYAYNANDGRVDIYYGGANLDTYPEVTINTLATNSDFGYSVALGDVNSDGFADIIVGASKFYGSAYVFNGGISVDGIPDTRLTGEGGNDYLGIAVACIGDLNNDGFEEFVVGAPGNNSYRGKVFLYKNKLTGSDIPDIILQGSTGSQFGFSLAPVGDVNGDGFGDFLVGAPAYNSYRGAAYLFYGGPFFDNSPDVSFYGTFNDGENFGYSVAGAGDVNGDGFADIIIGAPESNRGTTQSGAVYIYYGGVNMDDVPDLILSVPESHAKFGYSIAGVGDVNGDGFADVLVGAPLANYFSDSTDRGEIFLFFGGNPMDAYADFYVTGVNKYSQLGIAVAAAGDVNADGYSDFIVGGNYMKNSSYISVGKAIIYFGAPKTTPTYYLDSVCILGTNPSELLGNSVCSAGDVNGDGYGDVLIGSPGKVSVYCGSSSRTLSKILSISRPGTTGGFGRSLEIAPAGDVNGDGYSDVLIGGMLDGKAYIYFGGPAMNADPDITLGNSTTGVLGYYLAPIGDFNYDGYADVMAGSTFDFAGANTDKVSIFLSSPPAPRPRIIKISDVPGDQGGKVNIVFYRSGYDVPGVNKIAGYQIERSAAPGGIGFAWSTLTTLIACNNPIYSYEAPTQSDSMNYFYRITAIASNGIEKWQSNIQFGMSVDNLAPTAVKNFTAGASGAANRLSWKANTENDLKQYRIYRSTETTIDPNTAGVFAITTDTVYLDNAPLNYAYNYFIVAEDIHNNIGAVTSTPAPSSAVNLTAFLEGFYNETLNQQIADTVHLYLRDIASPYAIVDECAGVLDNNGVGQFKFYNAASGNYYLVLKHRNSIQTWSKLGGEALTKGSSMNYNFTTSSSQAYSDNMILKGSKWCVFGGDVNQDDIVDFSDMSMIDNDAYNYLSGYLVTDATGDNFVDFSDLSLADNNSYNYVSAVYPNSMKKTPAPRGTLKTKYIPKQYSISDGYPNPFNPSTRLNITLPKESKVTVIVYNTLGETIRTLVDEVMPAGFHNLYLNLPNAASGTYLVRFTADNYVQTKKIILMK